MQFIAPLLLVITIALDFLGITDSADSMAISSDWVLLEHTRGKLKFAVFSSPKNTDAIPVLPFLDLSVHINMSPSLDLVSVFGSTLIGMFRGFSLLDSLLLWIVINNSSISS